MLTGRVVTWGSSNTAVLTVSGSGLVTAAGVGTATITATSESVSATTPTITVNPAPPPPVNTVTVSPTSATLAIGGTQQLTAVLRDAANNVLIGRTIIWTSSNNAVASVNSNGLVTAAGAGGPITITATSEGRTGTSSITVSGSLTIRANAFITSGLSSPTFLTQPLNDGRIFVVQQGGIIRVVRDGALQATPFLNITSSVLSGGERGLLSVAFHPQYATNHYFYVYYTAQTTGEIRIERYTTTSDPSVADPLSAKLIFSTPHPSGANHNGGLVTFGPDGMLYAAFGDGGGGTPDQDRNGQNFNAYLAGMIRINVDVGDPYSVPSDNPFVGVAGRRPELWAKGFRNPWRYAFDAPTGLLFIADVGEGAREEVDAVPATQGGLNYGWSIMEGSICFNGGSCSQAGLTLPILDYGHSPACSITGGYVYRGSAMPAVQGHYFYSDFCAGWLRSLRYQSGSAVDQRDWGITSLPQVKSFGQDFAGELYIVSGSSIYKIVPGP